MEIRHVALMFNDAPLEFRRSLVNAEHYEYFSDLAKSGGLDLGLRRNVRKRPKAARHTNCSNGNMGTIAMRSKI